MYRAYYLTHEATVQRVSRRKAMLATGRRERTAMIDLENGKNSIVGMGGYSNDPSNAHKPAIIPGEREREQIITIFPRDFLRFFSAAPFLRCPSFH